MVGRQLAPTRPDLLSLSCCLRQPSWEPITQPRRCIAGTLQATGKRDSIPMVVHICPSQPYTTVCTHANP